MPSADINRPFTDVDRAADPALFVRHLDTARAAVTGHPYRIRKYELLHAEPGMRLLDAGCGAGTDLAVLAALVPRRSRSWYRQEQAMMAKARQRPELAGLSVELQQGDVYQLAWPEASFDACHTVRLLHHLEAPEDALAQAWPRCAGEPPR